MAGPLGCSCTSAADLISMHPATIWQRKVLHSLLTFILHWCLLTILLWLASKVFHGIEFRSSSSLWVSALLLGFANAVIRPLFIVFTLPLTLLTFGFFLLVINALMLLLVSALVRGFKVSGFWTAFFAGLFISAFSLLIDIATSTGVSTVVPTPHGTGTMVEACAIGFVVLISASSVPAFFAN